MNWHVSPKEMKDHLIARQAHHEARADFYTKKMIDIEESQRQQLEDEEDPHARMMTKTSNMYTNASNERDQARNSARQHASKAVAFKWKADHVPNDDFFLIRTDEANELEFLSSTNW